MNINYFNPSSKFVPLLILLSAIHISHQQFKINPCPEYSKGKCPPQVKRFERQISQTKQCRLNDDCDLPRGYLCQYGRCTCFRKEYTYTKQFGCSDPNINNRFSSPIVHQRAQTVQPSQFFQRTELTQELQRRKLLENISNQPYRPTTTDKNFDVISLHSTSFGNQPAQGNEPGTAGTLTDNARNEEKSLSEMLKDLKQISEQFERSLGSDVNTKTNKLSHSVDRRQSSSSGQGSLLSFVLPLVKGLVSQPVVRRDETAAAQQDGGTEPEISTDSGSADNSFVVANTIKSFIDTVQPVVPALRELRMRLSIIRKVRMLIQRIQERIRSLRMNLFRRINANVL